jgi:predicted membrane protein
MTYKSTSPSYLWPILLISFGLLFLLDNFGYLDFGYVMTRYWPVIIILIGLKILWSRRDSVDREVQIFGIKDEEPDRVTSNVQENSGDFQGSEKVVENVFGDIRLKFHNKTIGRFKASNVFGDFDLDFSQASIPDQSLIQVTGVFGDINICLPTDIHLEVQLDYVGGSSRIIDEYQSGLFKKVSYTTPDSGKNNPTVFIKISLIFGDIWVYNSTKS